MDNARVYELGPVSYPAYACTTAAVRSLTDWYVLWTPARRQRALKLLALGR